MHPANAKVKKEKKFSWGQKNKKKPKTAAGTHNSCDDYDEDNILCMYWCGTGAELENRFISHFSGLRMMVWILEITRRGSYTVC